MGKERRAYKRAERGSNKDRRSPLQMKLMKKVR
jgi:hypothetical protein